MMEITIIGLLILLNGFFALSEIALVSSKRSRLETEKSKGSKGAKMALKMLDNSENFLSAIQVGITLIGIVTGVYGGINIAEKIAPFFQKFQMFSNYAYEIALSITVIVITYFSIVFGELVPKTIGIRNSNKIAVFIAPIIYYFSLIFYPFVKLLSISTQFINSLLGIKNQSEHITEDELKQMLKMASNEGVIEKEQNIIHEKVFYFSDKKAKHIMTHRTDVEWIDLEDPKEQIHEQILKSKHSKILICQKNVDKFIGILRVKDYLIHSYENKDFSITEILSVPIVVAETTDAQKVLELFRSSQNYIAVVVDEHGSFEGLITLHDIMENIVGELPEEDEQVEQDIFVREDNSFLVSGDAPIETLTQVIEGLEIDFERDDYSTVAGFVLHHIEKIPQVGDKFDFNEYTIEVMDIDGNKIDKILVWKK